MALHWADKETESDPGIGAGGKTRSMIGSRPANLSNARYVGSQPNLEIRWAISEHFLAALKSRWLHCRSILAAISSV
jgi:hypothetical protein